MGQTVFTFFPEHELQIEVPVYEGDIVNIESGDTAIVSLVAFPDKQLEASVLNVDYAATLVDGAVHYKVTLALAEVPEGVRPDMTADVRFSVVYKEQALLIPERAVERRESRTYVQVARNGGFGEREVLVGQRSEGRMIEVIEGLELGERVLVR
jgi:HlyD family secretion protein